MIKYVDFKKFEYLQMDTDSAYIAISGMSLLDIIKPEMRERFIKSLKDLSYNWYNNFRVLVSMNLLW